jgi:hypothetical protein
VSPTLSPTALPRAGALTDALMAAAGPAPTLGQSAVLTNRFQVALRTICGSGRNAPRLRVDAFFLRSQLAPQANASEAFSWSPRTARRKLGLVAARQCLTRRCTPAEAVHQAIELSAGAAAEGVGRPDSLGHWLKDLPLGARAAVQAETLSWTTQLFHALEWDRLGASMEVGPADRWWDCPVARQIGMRGRCDVRALLEDRTPVLFSLMSGRPGPTSRAELGLAGLVDVLTRPGGRPPARVVGWWPQCGRALVAPVDVQSLQFTVNNVLRALGAPATGGGLVAA